jgi:hypothetical protein
MAKTRLTRKRLILELRKLLAQPDTKIIQRKCKTCGHSKWFVREDGTIEKITIYADARRIGYVQLVIHELLHIFMEIHLRIGTLLTYDLEEVGIEAWEKSIYKTIAHNDKELESWSEAIRRKMG